MVVQSKGGHYNRFFGYNESFEGAEGLENYKNELEAFIVHTLSKQYNGNSTPELVLVSPIAFENLSGSLDLPDGMKENKNLEMYTSAMKEVSEKHKVRFVDAFHPSEEWFSNGTALTIDGFQLNDEGYQKFADLLISEIFDESEISNEDRRNELLKAVKEKISIGIVITRFPMGYMPTVGVLHLTAHRITPSR